MRTKGEGGGGGVKNEQKFADVLYGWPLINTCILALNKRHQNNMHNNISNFTQNIHPSQITGTWNRINKSTNISHLSWFSGHTAFCVPQ